MGEDCSSCNCCNRQGVKDVDSCQCLTLHHWILQCSQCVYRMMSVVILLSGMPAPQFFYMYYIISADDVIHVCFKKLEVLRISGFNREVTCLRLITLQFNWQALAEVGRCLVEGFLGTI